MTDKFVIIDTSQVTRRLQAALGNTPLIRRGVLKQTILAAEKIAKDSTPVDTGNLKGNIAGTVDSDGEGATLRTNGVEYAAKQHEDLTLHHHVGGAKFIENAINEAGEEHLLNIAAAELKKIFGGQP